jgi:hypothetical protein
MLKHVRTTIVKPKVKITFISIILSNKMTTLFFLKIINFCNRVIMQQMNKIFIFRKKIRMIFKIIEILFVNMMMTDDIQATLLFHLNKFALYTQGLHCVTNHLTYSVPLWLLQHVCRTAQTVA